MFLIKGVLCLYLKGPFIKVASKREARKKGYTLGVGRMIASEWLCPTV